MSTVLVANVAAKSPNDSGFTTGAIDTTGASLLVANIGSYSGTSEPTLSDSKGSTWTLLTVQSSGADGARSRIYYAENPTVGAGHTFTVTGNDSFAALCVTAWSGPLTSSVFDQENGATTGGATSLATGSVTPSENNELIVAGLCLRDISNTGDTVSINGGFTISDQQTGVANQCLEAAQAYLVQGALAAANPTWSWTTSDKAAATIATFKGTASQVIGIVFRSPVVRVAPIAA